MTSVEFMSQQHVDRMNALLESSAEVRSACSQLPAPRTLAYRLAEGPDGRDVHWRVTCRDTVQFSLDDGPADLVLVGGWAQMIRSSRAARDGEAVDAGVSVEGDPAVLAEVGPVLAVARTAATVDVRFPEL